MASSVKQQWKLGLLHILLVALLVSQASLLFQIAYARALEPDRKMLAAATDEVTNQVTKKATKTPTIKDTTMESNYYGGGSGGWGHGGGGWGHGGGGWGHGGGGWGHGGGGWGGGGGGWEHPDGKKP